MSCSPCLPALDFPPDSLFVITPPNPALLPKNTLNPCVPCLGPHDCPDPDPSAVYFDPVFPWQVPGCPLGTECGGTLGSLKIVGGSSTPYCACVGTALSVPLSVTGSAASPAVVWTVYSGTLPPGLTLTGSGYSVTISGTLTTAGNYTFSIKASAGPFTFVTIPVLVSVLSITTTTLPNYTVGTPYSYQLVAAGGSGVYNWEISSGSLPPGLTMSLTGLISGTPTA